MNDFLEFLKALDKTVCQAFVTALGIVIGSFGLLMFLSFLST